jgi:hypothetical protein
LENQFRPRASLEISPDDSNGLQGDDDFAGGNLITGKITGDFVVALFSKLKTQVGIHE